MFSRVKIVRFLLLLCGLVSVISGQTESTSVEGAQPARKLASKPTHIYGDEKPVDLGTNEKQGIVAALTILLFVLMALDFTGPEVLFLIALMIVCLCQILTLPETLSGQF